MSTGVSAEYAVVASGGTLVGRGGGKMFSFRRLGIGMSTAVLVAAFGVLSIGAPANAALLRCQRPTLTSHQGARADGDGNTIPAYLGAVERGARSIEVDVRLTKDRRFVMFHNAYLNGTTTGRGYIINKTLAEIQKFRTARSHNWIPSLGQTLDRLKPFTVRLQLELKQPELWRRRDVTHVVRLVRAHHMAGRVTFYSLDVPTVRRIHATWPRLTDAWKSVYVNVDPAKAATFTDGVVLNYRSLTRTKVRAVHRKGLTAYSARLNGPSGWRKAVYAGTDTVLTTQLFAYETWCADQAS